LTLRRSFGVGLALLCFELLLRLVAHGQPTLDPQKGWIYKATTVRHWLGEGHGVSHWSPQGIRESPFRPDRPSTVVLVLGDSITEGLQVSDQAVYPAQLELALQRSAWPAAVLNAGRSTLSSADYIATAQLYRDEFRPTWTIVQLRLDDLTTDCRQPSRTHFTDRNGHLTIEVVQPRMGRVSRWLAVVRRASALVDVAIARAGAFRAASRLPPMFRGGASEAAQGVRPPEVDYPIEEELAMLASAWSGRLTIALVPDSSQDAGPIERRAIDYCRRNGVSIVDLRDVFLQFERAQSSPFGFPNSQYGFGHLNAEGHRALAGLLASELKGLRARGLL